MTLLLLVLAATFAGAAAGWILRGAYRTPARPPSIYHLPILPSPADDLMPRYWVH